MTKNVSLPNLTKAEFDILRIIWKNGKLSVREVHDQVTNTHDWVYSTTKTMMDRMTRKQLLVREKFHGVFLYSALISRPTGFTRLIQFFCRSGSRARFQGSSGSFFQKQGSGS